MSVAGSASAEWMANPSDPATTLDGAFEDWLSGREGRDFQPGVWLEVNGGELTRLEEQYVP